MSLCKVGTLALRGRHSFKRLNKQSLNRCTKVGGIVDYAQNPLLLLYPIYT